MNLHLSPFLISTLFSTEKYFFNIFGLLEIGMTSNRQLVEELTKIKAERDALREKERANESQREVAKNRVRRLAENELEKRNRMKSEYELRLAALQDELQVSKENRETVRQMESAHQRILREKNQQLDIVQENNSKMKRELEAEKAGKRELERKSKELHSLKISNNLLMWVDHKILREAN